jgi:predicted DNA-binding transcriptional regulator AlpA
MTENAPLASPPAASDPLQAWLDWAVGEMRYEAAVNVTLRWSDVEAFSGMTRSTLREAISAGEFPRPFLLRDGGRSVGFDFVELLGWKMWRLARRGEIDWKEGRETMEAIRGLRRPGRRG